MGDVSRTEVALNAKVPKSITHKYGEHNLQTVSVWPVASAPEELSGSDNLWIIYIHGGAWRDPLIDNTSIIPTLKQLLSPKHHDDFLNNVAAVASIDYRLSPHPDHPQDPATTPATELRNARHPDHINNVISALSLLQSTYGFGSRYVLVGHSCGATLSFQTVMEERYTISAPVAIVGVCGIYDINLMINNHASSPWAQVYRDFVVGAFGPDEKIWNRVSPAKYADFSQWAKMPADNGSKVVMVASSSEDELIEAEQGKVMGEVISQVADDTNLVCKIVPDLSGAHDEIWSHGSELARCIMTTIHLLKDQ